MSRGVNRVTLVGNLGADPEMRSTTSGVRVATLSVATSRNWKNAQGQEQTATEWHRVILWRGLAEVAEKYLHKGDRVYLEGRIEYRQWQGQDGQTMYSTEIVGHELVMLGSPSSSGSRTRQPQPAGAPADFSEFSNEALAGEDDLPF